MKKTIIISTILMGLLFAQNSKLPDLKMADNNLSFKMIEVTSHFLPKKIEICNI